MYEQHPKFKIPNDENVVIWRYLPLWKFKSLIEQNSLHFAKVSSFNNEGELSPFNDTHRREFYLKEQFANEEQFNLFLHTVPITNRISNMRYRDLLLINCWHFDEDVNDIMWNKYGEIAIKSTYRQLRDSFQDNTDDVIWIGEIDYADIHTQWMDESNAFSPFFIKGNTDKYERELRVATCLPDDNNSIKVLSDADKEREKHTSSKKKILNTNELTDYGKLVEINLDILIDTIHIDSKADSHCVDKIKEICAKNSLNKEIIPHI